ncbi:hypothetical protein PILCRDRAFT_739084 [Piloderma croceum F 1598]|uniref:Uncharacterized protein n=1 Tax=Piloderma croceum (strain F 1598) TaxID=765440 RepID=A0A0C3EJ49_PILCF|nr:hypothetical protein PILCRDRAFT_739084 [Piloderma croceum F 1598]
MREVTGVLDGVTGSLQNVKPILGPLSSSRRSRALYQWLHPHRTSCTRGALTPNPSAARKFSAPMLCLWRPEGSKPWASRGFGTSHNPFTAQRVLYFCQSQFNPSIYRIANTGI